MDNESKTNENTEKAQEVAGLKQRVVKCPHTITKGNAGGVGSWCIDCDEKIYNVDDRECKDCIHFFKLLNYTGCKRHLMAVIPEMHVTYKIEEGTCWEGI